MPNTLAYLMLIGWPLVMVVLFQRLPFQRAVIWSLLAAYLILPPEPAHFEVPLLQALNKENIPVIMLAALALWKQGWSVFSLPSTRFGKLFVVVLILVPIATVYNNREPLIFLGGYVVPGLRINDALGLCLQQVLILVPFLIAYNMFSTSDAHHQLLKAFVIAGVGYSVLMLIEIRLSPQLNNWIYGYYQHSFAQTIRFGGFRPIVFLEHGLWVAIFSMISCLSALILWRATPASGSKTYLAAFLYLGVVLFLCKSLGALVFALFLVPLILLTGRKMQLTIAVVISVLVLSYPILKTTEALPSNTVVAQAAKISSERAQSLQFRFANEDALLERGNEKPFFGWGSWGRNHLRDPWTGEIQTVTDGYWIIVFGAFGWVGFLAEFGLLTLGLFRLHGASRLKNPEAMSKTAAAMALILAINVLDLLPNATVIPLTWLFSGALLGYADRRYREHKHQREEDNKHRWKSII